MRMTRRWIKADDQGVLQGRAIAQAGPGMGWRALTDAEEAMTAARPEAFLYPPNGPITPRREVRVVISTTRIVADGEDAVSVRVEGIEPGESAQVRVNDDLISISHGDLLLVQSDQPGGFRITLEDHRFYARSAPPTVVAVPPENTDAN